VAGALTRTARRLRSFVAAMLAAVAALLPAAAARADVDVDARFGHGGAWIADAATPVEVVLRNRAAAPVTVTMKVRQSGFGESDSFLLERTAALGPNAVRAELFLVPGPTGYSPQVEVECTTSPSVPLRGREKTGDRGQLTIELSDVYRASQGARPDQQAILGVLLDPRNAVASSLANRTVQLVGGKEDKGTPVVALPVDADHLRLAPFSLDGIGTLVVCDPDASFCADPAHLEALLDWVALGGRLVVSFGEHTGSFAASPLAPSIPAQRSAPVLGEYADLVDRLGVRDFEGQVREGPVVALTPDASLGGEGDSVLVEARHGSGTIAALGFDLRAMLEAVSHDDAAVSVVVRATLPPPPVRLWEPDPMHVRGTVDVADGVGTILRQGAFRPPPVAAVLLGLFVYVLVVGPLDWFVLRRMRKERLTTFTFAGAVLVFTVVAYGVSIFLFASDAVVNRITYVQFASDARSGRELVRIHDLAGYYAPTSDTRRLANPLPATLLGGSLPGLRQSGGVGAALPIVVRGNDPIGPDALVEIAFRSQRVVRTTLAGTTGKTIELRRTAIESELEIVNSLPIALQDCWVFLPGGKVAVVGPVDAGAARRPRSPVDASSLQFPGSEDVAAFGMEDFGRKVVVPAEARRFLAMVATAPLTSRREIDGWLALRAAGIVRDPPQDGRALVVATADALPFDLPASGEPGRRHVVLVKETDLK
jgi:hypothetical protein